jgi:hypothetical protein
LAELEAATTAPVVAGPELRRPVPPAAAAALDAAKAYARDALAPTVVHGSETRTQ